MKGKGKKERYQIVSGSRRFEALRLLQERGELPEDFTVAVEVRDDLSKDDTLRIATVENLQRQNHHAAGGSGGVDQADSQRDVTLDDVVAQTGLSATTIKRRLALNNLCREAKAAADERRYSRLSQAEALTLGSDEAQTRIVEQIAGGGDYSAEEIRAALLDDRPTVALAIFPPEKYTGTITTDLFAEDETSYFDDAEQFFALQKEAVEELRKHHEASAAWVDGDGGVPHSPTGSTARRGRTRKAASLSISRHPARSKSAKVWSSPKIEKETAEAIAENPIAPVKVKAAYSAPLCRYIAHHKTAAVAEILLASPRTAQEVLIVRTLKGFRLHEAFAALGKEAEPQSAYRVLEEQARCFAGKLGFAIEEGESVWSSFPPPFTDELALYEAVRGLSDHDLAGLQTLLAALSFGQGNCDRLDTSDSLFNRVARDLSVDMKNHWRPDAAFFGKRNREQLVGIAKECGYADGNGSLGSYKKSELDVLAGPAFRERAQHRRADRGAAQGAGVVARGDAVPGRRSVSADHRRHRRCCMMMVSVGGGGDDDDRHHDDDGDGNE